MTDLKKEFPQGVECNSGVADFFSISASSGRSPGSQGDFLRIAGAEDEGENPGCPSPSPIASRSARVSLPASTCFSTSAAFSSPRRALQGVAGDDGEPGVAVGRLLAGLHDDARRFEFDQGVVRLGLVHGNVDDQPGRFVVVEEGVDLPPQLEEAAVVTSARSCSGWSRVRRQPGSPLRGRTRRRGRGPRPAWR